jgi:hypothetical protein
MRLIIEKDIEHMDFEEIILSEDEIDQLHEEDGIVNEFKSGFNKRPLNVYIRKEHKENNNE